jgi:hypothetical protein
VAPPALFGEEEEEEGACQVAPPALFGEEEEEEGAAAAAEDGCRVAPPSLFEEEVEVEEKGKRGGRGLSDRISRKVSCGTILELTCSMVPFGRRY